MGENMSKNANFTKIPNYYFDHLTAGRIKLNQFAAICFILKEVNYNPEQTFTLSVRKLASELNLSRGAAEVLKRELKASKLILEALSSTYHKPTFRLSPYYCPEFRTIGSDCPEYRTTLTGKWDDDCPKNRTMSLYIEIIDLFRGNDVMQKRILRLCSQLERSGINPNVLAYQLHYYGENELLEKVSSESFILNGIDSELYKQSSEYINAIHRENFEKQKQDAILQDEQFSNMEKVSNEKVAEILDISKIF